LVRHLGGSAEKRQGADQPISANLTELHERIGMVVCNADRASVSIAYWSRGVAALVSVAM
jgi:hypothetical protein